MSTFWTRSLHAAALALAGALLLAPSSGLAQRRVITGKPAEEKKEEAKPAPAAEPAKEEPKKAEEAKKEEPKQEEAKKEEPKKAEEPKKEEARKPVAAQPEPGSPNSTPPPASKDEPRRPIGAEPKKETPAETPAILVPKDEQGAQPGKAASAAPKADEALYRKKVDKVSVTLRVRPARPMPGKTTTLVFELVKHLAVPDPALGDRVPLEKAVLFADVGKDGGPTVRYRLHALSDAGVYGIHLTGAEAGPYRIALEQRLENAEIGDKPLAVDFVLGIGQDTAMQAAEEDTGKGGRSRSALRAGEAPPAEGAPTVMKALGDGWMELTAGLAKPNTGTDLVATARALAEAAAKLVGQAPAAFSAQRRDFDALATENASALKDLVPLVGTDAAKAREAMSRIETASCAKCHVKYRFRITDDVSAWPKFTPKAPKDAPAQSGPRKPVK